MRVFFAQDYRWTRRTRPSIPVCGISLRGTHQRAGSAAYASGLLNVRSKLLASYPGYAGWRRMASFICYSVFPHSFCANDASIRMDAEGLRMQSLLAASSHIHMTTKRDGSLFRTAATSPTFDTRIYSRHICRLSELLPPHGFRPSNTSPHSDSPQSAA